MKTCFSRSAEEKNKNFKNLPGAQKFQQDFSTTLQKHTTTNQQSIDRRKYDIQRCLQATTMKREHKLGHQHSSGQDGLNK